MKVLIQRSGHSSVAIDGKIYNEIEKGLVIFSCFTQGDTVEDIDYIVRKIVNLRIFDDENGIMNKSILDTSGSILSISQFTLYADTAKGNRPSYIKALKGEESTLLYDEFNKRLNEHVLCVTGKFGADMKVNILNDGPVTIIIDSKNR
ncbi:MAG: D-tyrosyl-tRNA(Tyr) deacylase [Firmicutes bacterium]|nr:D-tyrosyl-tRNA(Tyr) deacylase [Bacillota bacterium]